MAELRVPSELSLMRSGVVLVLNLAGSGFAEVVGEAQEDEVTFSGLRRREGVTGGLNS